MKVLFLVVLIAVSVCSENSIETPVGETLVKETTAGDTLIKEKPVDDTLLKEKLVVESLLKETPPKDPLVPHHEVEKENFVVEKPTVTETDETKPEDETRINDNQRIASGVDAVTGENLDFVHLSVVFYNQMQTCGGVLVHPQYVLTTASCVKDPVEGVASIVNATFPQRVPPVVQPQLQIFVHEGYDPATYANNVALIKLQNATTVDNKTLAVANYSMNTTSDLYVNQTLRLCGFGSIANYYTRPTKMRCTDLFIQPAANCSALTGTICSYWRDRDNNACNNDYGGPIYQYSYSGAKITQTVVGIASHSPDYRPNAPCYDGHKVVHVQTSNYLQWIAGIITPA